MSSPQPVPELQTLKARSRQTWMDGDYGKVAQSIQAAAEEFVARFALAPGTRVLDVACGTGNVAIPAAKAGAEVTGIDIAPNLLEQARHRARAESLSIAFVEGDVEDLPYADESFDLVLTMFGAMFAPRPERTAAELLRVCRRGGSVAMANWTPGGFSGQMFRLVGSYVPPPPVPPPVLWGDEQVARERLRDGASSIKVAPRRAEIRYAFPPEEVVDYFRTHFGPVRNAFLALPEDRRPDLHRDLAALWSEHNRATDGTTWVSSEYLEVVATRA
ncbi:MAG TPA: class I SAM-dependent methyltransferase [Sphingomicrobium sp.]|nr:class I SAM-dependent methyltransferase [Sphingomicrobium sp.]